MSLIRKAMADVLPSVDGSSTGSFDIVLSTSAKDRDGEQVKTDEWQLPLPARINLDIDHGMSVASTVGSGTPFIDGLGRLRVVGVFASTELAQNTRRLVTEGHITKTSVSFLRHKGPDGSVRRELLNGAFVSIPANDECVVLSSKFYDGAMTEAESDRILERQLTKATALVEIDRVRTTYRRTGRGPDPAASALAAAQKTIARGIANGTYRP